MDNEQRKAELPPSVDPRAPRATDNLIGTDDIGLPEDMVPDEARKPDQIRPEPDRLPDGH